MPIKPENKHRYPPNWKAIVRHIIARAKGRCEFCGAYNYRPHPETDSKVILTIAHLDHIPEHCNDDNLKALCQKCHNTYDIEHRKETRMKVSSK
jgi:5-methylcytosine-specific restriction endonuclease McrA